MKRTRKWAYVEQEAKRLVELGLSATEIARRLEVEKRSVYRWMSSGKLLDTRRGAVRPASTGHVNRIVKPSEWASTVRSDFALDATDEQLVTLAEVALGKALDPLLPISAQLSAAGRFQAIVKQLALVARVAADTKPEEPKRKTAAPVRTGTDPRGILTGL